MVLTKPFYVATTPVTQAVFQAVMRQNPSFFTVERGSRLTSVPPQAPPAEPGEGPSAAEAPVPAAPPRGAVTPG